MGDVGMCTATLLVDPMSASADDVRAAVDASVAAGCSELSMWAQHIPADSVSASGAHVAVVEAAMAWADDASSSSDVEAEAAFFARLAADHGATVIAAVTMHPALADLAVARDRLGTLVAAASDVGAQVCVEFLPWSGVPTLAAAWDLVEPLGPGAGILLDTWHWHRQPSGPDLELLRRIPGERIGYVQVCDAAAEPGDDVLTEAMSARLVPGDGVVDFGTVFTVLGEIGASPFVATEVFNPALVAELGMAGAATRMAEAGGRSSLGL